MRRARLIILMAVLAALAAAGYALASTRARTSGTPISVACTGPGDSMLWLTGRVPQGVDAAYLLYASGASIQAAVREGRYAFLLTARQPSRLPLTLEYLDARGRRHEQRLFAGRFSRCAARAADAVSSNHFIRVEYNEAPLRRRPGESPNMWAIELINAARVHVTRTVASCSMQRMVPAPQPVKVSEGTPSSVLLASLGVLDRPPTPDELALTPSARGALGWPGIYTVFRRYTRIVHGPDGFLTTIVVGEGRSSRPAIALPACQRDVSIYLDGLLRGQPGDVKRDARHVDSQFKLGAQFTGVHPWLSYTVSHKPGIGGGGFGPFNARQFRRSGMLGSGQFSSLKPYSSVVYGLVPDGVVSVSLELPAHVTRGYHERYPEPYAATAQVTANTFIFPRVPRDAAVAVQRTTIIWRDAQGHIVRVVHEP